MIDQLIIDGISIRYIINRVSVGKTVIIRVNVCSHYIELWRMAAQQDPVKIDFVIGDWNARVTGLFNIDEFSFSENCILSLESLDTISIDSYAETMPLN